jgi:DinB superfamily
MSSSPLPRWFARIAQDLDAADARAAALIEALTPAQLNWKPAPKAWSVGQCLEHLCVSNEVYVVPIWSAVRHAPKGVADEITPGWFARWFIRRYIEPATFTKPGRAPRKASPRASEVDASIGQRFVASNDAMRALMVEAREIDVNRVRFRNPFVPVIHFTVGTGMLIIARHNHRHLDQAERVLQRLE